MFKITGRKPGANLTLMNTLSWWGPDPDNEGKNCEFLSIVYKDNDTMQKHVEEIIDPSYTYYLADPNNRVDYNRLFIEEDKAQAITVPHRNVEQDIASRVGLKEFYYLNKSNGNKAENKKLHLHPNVFNSDMNIEDYYRLQFTQTYQNPADIPSKAFFDIESDTINMVGDFPEPGECPINAISLILKDQQCVYVFLLRNKNNPQIAEFERMTTTPEFYSELQSFVINAVGGPEIAFNKFGINFSYKFLFYDEDKEIYLIRDLFSAINTFKPDFALAWNMGFDMPYIIARIQRLGYNPEDIMCHPDFQFKIARYYIDERNKSDFAERGDFCQLASYTTFLDQMIHFASRRKGQNKFISFSLDYIGEVVVKVKKLDYKNITTNIAELPYKDYKTFVFYNIMDTIVQYCIESATADIDYVFTKANANCTRYSKVHRQTVYLTNRVTKEMREDGFIIGNNCNKFNPKPTEKFPGAFVADPLQLSNYARMSIYGMFINCFDNAVDFDFSSLYPSIIREFNIAPNTQIGMLMVTRNFTPEEAIRANNTVAGAFIEDMISQVWLEIGTRWFNLADYTRLHSEVIEFFDTVMNPTYGLSIYDKKGLISPIQFNKPGLIECPIIFHDEDPTIKYNYVTPNYNKWEEWRNHAISYPNQRF